LVVRGESTTTWSVDHNATVWVLGGTFLLEQLIGSGNMGRVYQGRHLTSDQCVAVKLMHPRLQDDEDEGTLPISRIIGIMSQVLSALSEVHAHGLVSR
jgi:serine/threonine protein kinase